MHNAIGAEFVRRPVDRVLPKGAVHPLDVYELVGVSGDVDAKTVARCEAWGDFYEVYLNREWRAACEALARFIERFGEDSLTRLYAERVHAFREKPPAADWDGVIRYTTK